MNTKTPRTDPFIFEIDTKCDGKFPVIDAEISREIELELKAANEKIDELQSLLSAHEAALVNLHDITLDIYYGYHVSEKRNMPPSLIRAWNIGKEIFETMESERREDD